MDVPPPPPHLECLICASKFTSVLGREIKCPKCRFGVCLQCLKDDIKTAREDDENLIRCFNPECRKEFDLDFLSTFLSGSFIKKYVMPKKVHSHKSEQYALMGETQAYIKHLDDTEKWKKEVREVGYNLIKEYKALIAHIQDNIYATRPRFDKSKIKKEVFKCPTPDCRGYVSVSGECTLCKGKFCTECMEPMEEGHVCDEGTLKSIQMMKESSKPCPHCNMFIAKKDGCNQMWCFNCKGFWNWDTGEKITITNRHQIHNPDFIQWERQNAGGNIRTDLRPCDDIPRHEWQFQDLFQQSDLICRHFGKRHYIQYIYDGMWTAGWWISCHERKGDRYLNTRVKYLQGKLTKEKFELKIQQLKLIEIKDNKMAEILHGYKIQKKNILRNLLDISIGFKNYEVENDGSNKLDNLTFLGFAKLYSQIRDNHALDLHYKSLIQTLHYRYGFKSSFAFHNFGHFSEETRNEFYKMQQWTPKEFFSQNLLTAQYCNQKVWKDTWGGHTGETLDKFIEDNRAIVYGTSSEAKNWYVPI